MASDGSSGCPDAQGAIHRRYFARLVALCYARLGDRPLAEDIAQDTLIRAIAFLPSFDARRPLWPWLRGIALHLCANADDRRRRELVCAIKATFHTVSGDCSEKVVEGATLLAALGQIPLRQRRALTLRYLHDVDRDAAADLIGVNRNAFDQLLARGRTNLAAVMRSSEFR